MERGFNVHLSLTVFATTNKISLPQRESVTASAGRRMVIHEIKKVIEDPSTFSEARFSDREKLMYISHCLAIASAHDFPPNTVRMALLTIFRSSYKTTVSSIVFDEASSPENCVSACYLMSVRSLTGYDAIMDCVRAMNPCLVGVTVGGLAYIKGLVIATLEPCKEDHKVREGFFERAERYMDYDTLFNKILISSPYAGPRSKSLSIGRSPYNFSQP